MSLQNTDINNQNQNVGDNNNTNNTNNESRLFSEDYVRTLRSEAAENRIKAKNLEVKLRSALGIKEDETVEDWDAMITTFQTNLQKAQEQQLQKAKELLFTAELKKYEGQYNMKLVNKLLDTSKVQVDDDGKVTGLQEALKELEKEYPEIIKQQYTHTGVNPPLGGNKKQKMSVFDTIMKTKSRK